MGKKEWLYMYNDSYILLKLIQHCKPTTLQIKLNLKNMHICICARIFVGIYVHIFVCCSLCVYDAYISLVH